MAVDDKRYWGTITPLAGPIEPVWERADSLTLVPPAYGLGMDKLAAYSGAIASTFYG